MVVYTTYMNSQDRQSIRAVIFGVEDSLVSTTGLIAGISVGTSNKSVVIVSGLVAIAVEAISMGAGEYISDDSLEQADRRTKRPHQARKNGILMLLSYFFAGLIPLLPVILIDYPASLYVSITMALFGLLALGYIKGKLLHTDPWRGAVKVLIVGGLATALGIAVGFIFKV